MSRMTMSDQYAQTGMRILMIAPTPYFSDRGCHVRIFEEARALMAQGHQVRIVSYHLGRDLEPVPVERTIDVPWYEKREAGPSWHKLYLDLLLLVAAVRCGLRFRPKLVHGHLHEGALVGWLVAKLLRVPLVFDYQGSLTGESLNHGFFKRDSLLHRLFRAVEGGINRLADLVLTSSTPGRDELLENGLPEKRVVSFPDGVDSMVFRPLSRSAARQRLGFSDDLPLVVYLGLLNPYQGTDLLLKAAVLLKERRCTFHLLLMGFPDEAYRVRAEQLKLAGFVTFTGRVDYDDAPLLLSAGDLAVSPKLSTTEANGKLLNYMACGLPTVCFESPVNRELLGDDGIYAEPASAEDLARSIEQALQDHDDLQQRGKRLRLRAREEHGWKRRASQLEGLYQRLLTVAK
jgi:glycosyltransferase involved in cell wall biosynthesis